jgi:hypothetical protein
MAKKRRKQIPVCDISINEIGRNTIAVMLKLVEEVVLTAEVAKIGGACNGHLDSRNDDRRLPGRP